MDIPQCVKVGFVYIAGSPNTARLQCAFQAQNNNGWRKELGSPYDGKNPLLNLVCAGKAPMAAGWDVNLLFKEIKQHTDIKMIDILSMQMGSNNCWDKPCFTYPQGRSLHKWLVRW